MKFCMTVRVVCALSIVRFFWWDREIEWFNEYLALTLLSMNFFTYDISSYSPLSLYHPAGDSGVITGICWDDVDADRSSHKSRDRISRWY